MIIVSWTIAVLAAVASGGAVGFVQGFALAAHRDLLSDIRPAIRNPLLRWFCRPSRELSSAETLGMFALVMLWVVVFLGLCLLPLVVAAKLSLEEAIPFLLAAFVLGALVFGRIGKTVWGRVSTHAV